MSFQFCFVNWKSYGTAAGIAPPHHHHISTHSPPNGCQVLPGNCVRMIQATSSFMSDFNQLGKSRSYLLNASIPLSAYRITT